MRKQLNKVGGLKGETKAREFLKKKKYKILAENYKNRMGEIDIIASFKKMIIFVEVKQRETLAFGRPSEAVNEQKRFKIKNTASLYLLQNDLQNSQVRFDVIEILGEDYLNHIENAF
ncbi:MAG: YraN family protein [Clostridia bacterium]|jgi:putative endonuclease|nr:YraN family protein [Clostridia bacterium]